MTERWRYMEQLEAIYDCQPVFAGDLISKVMTKALCDTGLVTKNADSDYICTNDGNLMMFRWKDVEVKDEV